jgi:hypothetical protein
MKLKYFTLCLLLATVVEHSPTTKYTVVVDKEIENATYHIIHE